MIRGAMIALLSVDEAARKWYISSQFLPSLASLVLFANLSEKDTPRCLNGKNPQKFKDHQDTLSHTLAGWVLVVMKIGKRVEERRQLSLKQSTS